MHQNYICEASFFLGVGEKKPRHEGEEHTQKNSSAKNSVALCATKCLSLCTEKSQITVAKVPVHTLTAEVIGQRILDFLFRRVFSRAPPQGYQIINVLPASGLQKWIADKAKQRATEPSRARHLFSTFFLSVILFPARIDNPTLTRNIFLSSSAEEDMFDFCRFYQRYF